MVNRRLSFVRIQRTPDWRLWAKQADPTAPGNRATSVATVSRVAGNNFQTRPEGRTGLWTLHAGSWLPSIDFPGRCLVLGGFQEPPFLSFDGRRASSTIVVLRGFVPVRSSAIFVEKILGSVLWWLELLCWCVCVRRESFDKLSQTVPNLICAV